mgnify:CR=1 FL=1
MVEVSKISKITPMDIVNLEVSIELINTLSSLVNYKYPDKYKELTKLHKALNIENIDLINKTLLFFSPIAKNLKNNSIALEDFCNDVRYKFEF